MTTRGGQLVCGGVECKKIGLMDVDNSVVTAGQGGGVRGMDGNGKNTIKVNFKNI